MGREKKLVEWRDAQTNERDHIDPSTGEVMPKGMLVYVPERPKSPFGKDWFAMAQDALNFLANNRKILGEEGFAVFCALAARLDFENFIMVNQAEMADALNMKRQNFGRALKRLETLGVLTRGPKTGRSPTLRLNPSVAWKGKQRAHFNALQQARKNGWKLIDGGKDPAQPDLFGNDWDPIGEIAAETSQEAPE